MAEFSTFRTTKDTIVKPEVHKRREAAYTTMQQYIVVGNVLALCRQSPPQMFNSRQDGIKCIIYECGTYFRTSFTLLVSRWSISVLVGKELLLCKQSDCCPSLGSILVDMFQVIEAKGDGVWYQM